MGTRLEFESPKVRTHTQNASPHHFYCFVKDNRILRAAAVSGKVVSKQMNLRSARFDYTQPFLTSSSSSRSKRTVTTSNSSQSHISYLRQRGGTNFAYQWKVKLLRKRPVVNYSTRFPKSISSMYSPIIYILLDTAVSILLLCWLLRSFTTPKNNRSRELVN